MISALDVAKRIICRMNETGREITQLKLQKLLYFTEAYYMATYDRNELFKEQFYAWTYGPVCQEVYNEYKMYLSSPIPASESENSTVFDNEVEDSVLTVCNVLGDLTSSQLIQLTHMQNSLIFKTNCFKPRRILHMSNKNVNINSKHQFTESGVRSVLKNTNNFKNEYEIIVKSIAEKYTDDIKILSKELSSISKIKDNSEKEIKFEEFEKIKLKNLKNMEYIVNPDTELVRDVKIISALRHYYYNLKNNILSVKSEIINDKLDKCDKKINRISSLESKFENLGATVISIILSISIISAAITAIEKLKLKNVLVFVVSIVWFGMTYLLFVHYLFNKNREKNKGAVVLYTVITIVWILVLFYSCKGDIIGTFSTL